MKKILYILTALVLLASCQKETCVDTPATLTYTIVPEVSFMVKSGEEAATAVNPAVNSISYRVYHKKVDENGVPYYDYIEEMGAYAAIDNTSDIRVPITLFKDQEYKLVFIAQHRFESQQRTTGYAYNVTEEGTMSVNTDAPFTSGDQLEAFAFVDTVGPITGNENRKITLRRVVSQVNIGTSSDNFPSSLNIAVSGAAASYDIFNGEYSDNTSVLNFAGIDVPTDDKLTVSGKEYNRLATLYCLGSNKLSITMTDPSNAYCAFSIENVPTQVNYKTNVVGALGYGRIVEVADASAFIAALNNVEEGDLIRLTGNVIFDEIYTQITGTTDTYGSYYHGDKSFTIDLNGKNIEQWGPVNKYLLKFGNDSSNPNIITLKNGTIDAVTSALGAVDANGKITINFENVRVINNNAAGSTVKLTKGATLNVKSGTEINGTCSLYVIDCDASTANIYADAEVYLNSATSNDDAYLIRAVNESVINIYGGELWAFNSNLYYNDGTSAITLPTSLRGAQPPRHCEEHSDVAISRQKQQQTIKIN